ncbi:dioxygenase domain-containing protein [Trichoderma breve]|uniref:Dioxygenase domain-containing protein n=1 Tax=Trichoderma breve TaxID=2034170 RepID=A0A9W9BBA3_9HYPO|nr:dioxygenase domain-containing protein [Trichoderma breve]KAJ4856783.1 dioxygenase domain-containing protein [Trichoderma breve]
MSAHKTPNTKVEMLDLTTENITENVQIVNSSCSDRRVRYLFERLVVHLHDLVRETRLSTEEWMAAIEFLTKVGQKCTDTRQEFILLSDVLGVSLLVDAIDHPKPKGSTEGTVLGPFHTHEAEYVTNGANISTDPQGNPLLVICQVRNLAGQPIENARIDVWETDSKGFYDVQYADHDGPNGRAVLTSDKDGNFWFKGIVPVPYPIPSDGPVGKLLGTLNRHCYRPSHMHFMFDHPIYDPLVTALYLKNDPYETSDAVFGVKRTLVVELKTVQDKETAEQYGVDVGCALLKYEFVLVTKQEAIDLRYQNAEAAMKAQGKQMQYINGLPVPDID